MKEKEEKINEEKNPKEKWRKILYQKQELPDNYVSEYFLQDLNKNVDLKRYGLSEIILATCPLLQRICCVVLFLIIFYLLKFNEKKISFSIFIAILINTMILYAFLVFSLFSSNAFSHLKNVLILMICGFFVSPILKTLTETISTDTIYAMVTIMLVMHVAFYDYGISISFSSPSFSLNAVIFAAVCLASRLSNTNLVFTLLTFASGIFVLFSVALKKLFIMKSIRIDISLTIFFVSLSMFILWKIAATYLILLYFFFLITIGLILPFGFYKLQVYRQNIYGPWDEAILKAVH